MKQRGRRKGARADAHGVDAEAARAVEDGGATSRRRREGTKQAQLISVLKRPEGGRRG
ncbi:MAG: hypothetical protein IRY94_08615, partial [Rhodospirillaceae bacterium]|nr:hypothetical protein [Rhodospirillaceae bacterium]